MRQSVAELGYGIETGECRLQGWLRAFSVSVLSPCFGYGHFSSPSRRHKYSVRIQIHERREHGTIHFSLSPSPSFLHTISIIFNLLDLFFNFQPSSTSIFNHQPFNLQYVFNQHHLFSVSFLIFFSFF